jgi:hypothetical protein
MPPCGPHLTPLATGSLERSLLVFSTPGGLTGNDLSRLFFTYTVGGIRNQAFRIPKIKECLYPSKFLCERLSSETPGAIDSFSIFQNSSFNQYPSSPVELPNEFRIIQGVRVSVRLNDFSRDETSGANPIHPGSLGLGFARGGGGRRS